MAKEKGEEPTGQGRAEALRAAVEQAVAFGAGSTRGRAQEVADEIAAAAGRVRERLDDLRPPTAGDVRTLQRRIEALEARLAQLEKATAP